MGGKNTRKERVSCNVLFLAQGACRQSMEWKRNQVSETTMHFGLASYEYLIR